MNKMEQLRLKVHLALKLICLILFFHFSAFSQPKADSKNDYDILNVLITNLKKISSNKSVFLISETDNKYAIDIIKALEKQGRADDEEYIKVDRDSVLDKIFNERENKFLLSQRSNDEWDYTKIVINDVYKFTEKNQDESNIIGIGKPIYTSNFKYALVEINRKKWKGVQVLKKDKDKWVEYKLIAPISIQKKVKEKY